MIDDFDSIIPDINRRLSVIVDTGFSFDKVSDSRTLRAYQTHGCETALNRLEDDTNGEVSVYHWFDNYYIFMEIKLIYGPFVPQGKRKPINRIDQLSISISIFKKICDNITQIFRAEWDDFAEDQSMHPQPHWHFTADTALSKTFEEYAAEYGDEGFMTLLAPKKEDLSEFKKMHFAMNGQWAKQQSHLHNIETSSDLINWIGGVLNTIRKEIEYVNAT